MNDRLKPQLKLHLWSQLCEKGFVNNVLFQGCKCLEGLEQFFSL